MLLVKNLGNLNFYLLNKIFSVQEIIKMKYIYFDPTNRIYDLLKKNRKQFQEMMKIDRKVLSIIFQFLKLR